MKRNAPTTLRIDALFVAATACVTAGAAALAIGPHLMSSGPTPEQQQAQVEERRGAAKSLSEDLEKTKDTLGALKVEAEQAVALLPASAANARLEALTKLAADHHVEIAQISSLAPDAHDSRATVIPIKLSGAATYTAATEFLSDLRGKFRDTGVTAFRIAGSPSAASPPPSAMFTLDLAWYAEPAGSRASAAPADLAASTAGAGSAGAGTQKP